MPCELPWIKQVHCLAAILPLLGSDESLASFQNDSLSHNPTSLQVAAWMYSPHDLHEYKRRQRHPDQNSNIYSCTSRRSQLSNRAIAIQYCPPHAQGRILSRLPPCALLQ